MAKKVVSPFSKKTFGAMQFPDRKNPSLCVDDGEGHITVYGHFNSVESADKFMDEIAEIIGAVNESKEDKNNG